MHTTEYDVMQNAALGSLCQLAFVLGHWEATERKRGPAMALVPCVLPLAFHRESAALLHARRGNGGLLNALAEDRAFAVGLQSRVIEMTTQTFEALNVGFAARLFSLKQEEFTLEPIRLRLPRPTPSHMTQTAARLGRWFAHYPLAQICAYLQIRL